MKTLELDSKYHFNYLVAYQHAGMGLSLLLHPHLSLLVPLFAFISQQRWCFYVFCAQVGVHIPFFLSNNYKKKRKVI